MKVDVVPLRVKGQKRSREIAKATQAVCGDLTVRSRLGLGKEIILVATLAGGPQFELLLPALDHVRLTRMSGDSFILFGLEEVSLSRRSHQTYPQAWWCRPARQEELSATGDRNFPLNPAVMADLYLEQAEY
jgi:hypothetical protein